MKIEKKVWFTTKDGMIGIVLGTDELTKEKKAYIGIIPIGEDTTEDKDAKRINEWGTKFPVDAAELL